MPIIADAKTGGPFLGTWRNTNARSAGITEVAFDAEEGVLTMRVNGSSLSDRFEVRADVYADNEAAAPAKIMACWKLNSIDVQLHGWIKQGVLVLAIFRKFNADSDRSSYFDRDFFYQVSGPM